MKTLRLTLFLTTCFFILTALEAQAAGLKIVSNNAAFTDQKVPTSMDKEHVYTISYTVKNTGDVIWKKGECKLKVTVTPSDISKDNKWLVPNTDLPNDVSPGSEVTLTFKVTAWNEDGTYSFQAQMMQNEVTFGSPSTAVSVNIN